MSTEGKPEQSANVGDEGSALDELLSRLPPKDPNEVEPELPEETETPQDAFRAAWRPTLFNREKPEHEKQEVDYNGTPVMIDVQLVPLILRLWAKQWGTLNSCYNSSASLHLAYIHFATQEHAKLFFDTIANHVSLAVWDRRGNQGTTIRFPTDEIEVVTALFPEPLAPVE